MTPAPTVSNIEGRVVRVLPDEPGLNRTFDYVLPASLTGADTVRIGSIVRFSLSGRLMRGWITGIDVEPATDGPLKPIKKVSGFGPPRELLSLSKWAAHRWWGRPASLLRTASPDRNVPLLPRRPPLDPALLAVAVVADDVTSMARQALANGGATVVRIPPTADVFPLVIEAARFGGSVGTLVIAPSMAVAIHLARRLRRAGAPVALLPDDWTFAAAGGCVVVGSRAAAWAPMVRPGAIVVLDEHDETYQQEQMPTWNARDVAVERAGRLGVPCLLVSPIPSVSSVVRFSTVTPSRSFERSHWPSLQIIDRSDEEPGRQGLLSDKVGTVLRTGVVVCVLNRKGRAASLVCLGCHEIARCERCDGAMAYPDDVGVEVDSESDALVCRRCAFQRPTLCIACGRSKFRGIRMGVTRAREEVETLALRPTAEVTAVSPLPPDDVQVMVGTEAVLYRVPQADSVVFLDFDSELLAPRYRAAEQALALLVRAARLVEGRGGGGPGRLVVQTRLPDHEVLRAVSLADPDIVTAAETARRIDLRLPPYGALAVVSGAAALDVVQQLRGDERVQVGGPASGPYQIRASTSEVLADALAGIVRPSGRVRVEVDPMRA